MCTIGPCSLCMCVNGECQPVSSPEGEHSPHAVVPGPYRGRHREVGVCSLVWTPATPTSGSHNLHHWFRKTAKMAVTILFQAVGKIIGASVSKPLQICSSNVCKIATTCICIIHVWNIYVGYPKTIRCATSRLCQYSSGTKAV